MPARRALLVFVLLASTAFTQAPPAPPVAELTGPLVIVGGGKIPAAVRDQFFALAGREKAKIVVIPTAGGDADDPQKADSFLKAWQDLKPLSVEILHTRDRKTADDPDFAKPLAAATGVWFGGGDQSKLAEAYRGTRVEKELRKLHARGGVIGGTSAGAAVMSDVMIAGGKDAATTADGFGFLPGFVVDQHFTQRNRLARLQGVIADRPASVGLGIDEGTAVVARGRTLKVVGDGRVTVVAAKTATREAEAEPVPAGATLDLFQVRRVGLGRAATEPFPRANPPEPVVPKGSLVIVGGGGAGPEIWKKFVALAGGPDAVIVVVTTALEDPVPVIPTELTALQKFGAKTIRVLHTRDRKEADDPKFSDVLTRAGGVWFSGGRQWRFVDAYEGTLTEKRFHEVLARGGAVGGSSAGASIQAEYMPRGHPLGNTVMMAEGYEKGFGFLPGCAVDQHFFARKRTADMTALMKTYPQYLGIGIDEGTAIVVTGSVAEVIGRTRVAFYDYRTKPAGEKDYTEVKTGEKYDLKARKPVK